MRPSIGIRPKRHWICLRTGTKIDLVFSDIVMPGTIDGVGLAREIGSRYPDLPVVLTTGYSDAAKAVPANLRILRKPFDADTLREVIDDIARSRFIDPTVQRELGPRIVPS